MKRFPFPLRLSIPAILLVFGSLLAIFSFQREVSLSYLRTEEDRSHQAKFSGEQTSGTLEYLFRKADIEGANLVISKLAGDPNLELGILCDQNNKVILATRYELRDRPAEDTPIVDSLADIEKSRKNLSGQIIFSKDKQKIKAIYPVILGSLEGEIRPSKIGVLILEYNIAIQKNRAYQDALSHSLAAIGILTILSSAVWLFFNKTLTSRAIKLVKVSNKLATGKLDIRSQLTGSDELAEISSAFDKMADKIQANQQELQELAQREEVVNRLARQIRDSLDLEKILDTTVKEIYNLLKVDRCSFLWYRSNDREISILDLDPKSDQSKNLLQTDLDKEANDSSSYWEVVQEAQNPNLPSQQGKYPSQAIGPLANKIFKMELIRINDVDILDEPIMQKFLRALGHKALLVLPILTRTGKFGAIACTHRDQSRIWEDTEVELLQSVTEQITIAIEQAELYEKSRIAAVTAKEKAKQLKQTLQELQQTQTQLIQTEKMSSLGQLVAGVAHEINNPVNFIYGNLTHVNQYTQDLLDIVQLYQKYYPNSPLEIEEFCEDVDLEFLMDDLPKIIGSMRVGTERIREIVISLRNFSRLDEAAMKAVNIHEGIDSTLLILQSRLKAKPGQAETKIIKEYGDLPLVECYAGQLNQVFMNILSNAIDVLENENKKGQMENSCILPTIRIHTEVNHPDSVTVKISDNGPGMTEAVKKQLFDPFFTTKPVGKGTGLGLTISYQIIVEKHQGELWCESQPGKGTEFGIKIPIRQPLKISTSQAELTLEGSEPMRVAN